MIVKLLVGLTCAYLVVIAALYFFQDRLVYFPDPRRITPEEAGLTGVEEVVLERPAESGAEAARVVGWYVPARGGGPTLLYFHGNGGSLINRAARVAKYRDAGLGVLLMTYRGYGGSTGRPSEKKNIGDGQAAYRWLRDKGVAAKSIVVYGESLGSGIAVPVAAGHDVGALVLETPFSSVVDVGAERFRWAPVRLAIRDKYNSVAVIGQVKAPVLVLHGTEDEVVPYKFGKRLFDAASEPKTLKTYEGGRHNDLYSRGAWDDIERFLADLR